MKKNKLIIGLGTSRTPAHQGKNFLDNLAELDFHLSQLEYPPPSQLHSCASPRTHTSPSKKIPGIVFTYHISAPNLQVEELGYLLNTYGDFPLDLIWVSFFFFSFWLGYKKEFALEIVMFSLS